MLVEILATLNLLAAVVLAMLTFRYSRLREQSWQIPWPPAGEPEAQERERRRRSGLDARRMLCLLAALLVCGPLAIYLAGHLRADWLHAWLRIGTALGTMAAVLAALLRTGIHNDREYDCWVRRYR